MRTAGASRRSAEQGTCKMTKMNVVDQQCRGGKGLESPAARSVPASVSGEGPGVEPALSLAVVGHVDHGKSTLVGRLLADTDSLPTGKLERIRRQCGSGSRPFEYAFLIDALKDEQAQGITIDCARVFFSTAKRRYIVQDAPGHGEFLKNMVTGAARADAALLVIDAHQGLQENSRRHGYLVAMLGIRQVVVAVNKMDQAGYAADAFETVADACRDFFAGLRVEVLAFVPVAARDGDMVVSRGDRLGWYTGPTLLEALDRLETRRIRRGQSFRLPVQDVYRFTSGGDDRRIIVGRVAAGTIACGDAVVFYPSGKKSRIKTLEPLGGGDTGVSAGDLLGVTLTDEMYIRRGEVMTRAGEEGPRIASRLRVNLFWLGERPLQCGGRYLFKMATSRAEAVVAEIGRVIDAAGLEQAHTRDQVPAGHAAEVVLALDRAVACEPDAGELGRCVLVDGFQISGGGIVIETMADLLSMPRQEVFDRNYRWITSRISREARTLRYGHAPRLIVVTGPAGDARKAYARDLEQRFFAEGNLVYYLGIGNVIHGVGADVERRRGDREEYIRRMAEIAHLMLDAGMILIVTAIELTEDELAVITTHVDPDQIEVVRISDTGMEKGAS